MKTRFLSPLIVIGALVAIPTSYYAGVIQTRSEAKQTAFLKEIVREAFKQGQESVILIALQNGEIEVAAR